MDKWKIAFWCCLILLISVSLLSVYTIIDQGVTLTYQKEGYEDTENDLDQIIELINKTDLSKHEIIGILKDHRLSEFMDFNNDTISLERVLLIFENDELKYINKEW